MSTQRCVEVIDASGEALAALAAGHFDAEVVGCPGWRVRDVLQHLIEVHWFWTKVVEDRLTEPPGAGRPDRVEDDHLVSRFLLGVQRLSAALAAADQGAEVYTWSPAQRDVAFVTRHQVQEIMVHGWDAANAVGAPWEIAADAAADAIDEFLTFSVSSRVDPAEPPAPRSTGSSPCAARTSTTAGRSRTTSIPGPCATRRACVMTRSSSRRARRTSSCGSIAGCT